LPCKQQTAPGTMQSANKRNSATQKWKGMLETFYRALFENLYKLKTENHQSG